MAKDDPHKTKASAIEQRQRARKYDQKRGYKVQLEQVNNDGKLVGPIITYDERAPPGFVWVPLFPEFDRIHEYCRRICKEKKLVFFIVNDPSTRDRDSGPQHIPHHQNRVGHHYPEEVYDAAVMLGLKQSPPPPPLGSGQPYIDSARPIRPPSELEDAPSGQMSSYDLDLLVRSFRIDFPKIPEQDMNHIIRHAFIENDGNRKKDRVGRAKDLTLTRRIQLAVGAHVRHHYTSYDTLLRELKSNNAWTKEDLRSTVRDVIEPDMIKKVKEWRGEEDGSSAFRERIIISDDESSDDDDPRGRTKQNAFGRKVPAQGRSQPAGQILNIDGQAHTVSPLPAQALTNMEPGSPCVLTYSQLQQLQRASTPSLSQSIAPPRIAHTQITEHRGAYARPHEQSGSGYFPQVNSPLRSSYIHDNSGRIPRTWSQQDMVLPSIEQDPENESSNRPIYGQRIGPGIATATRRENAPELQQLHDHDVVTAPRGYADSRGLPIGVQRREVLMDANSGHVRERHPHPAKTYKVYPHPHPIPEHIPPPWFRPVERREVLMPRDNEHHQARDLQPIAQARLPRPAEARSMNPASTREFLPSASSSHFHPQRQTYHGIEIVDLTSDSEHSPRVRPEQGMGSYHKSASQNVPMFITKSVTNREYPGQPYQSLVPLGRMPLVSRHPEYESR